MDDYEELFQSWHFVQVEMTSMISEESVQNELDREVLRNEVQKKRIEKRYSIFNLSMQIGCDPDMLTLYERGDHILNKDIISKLKKKLEIG